MNAILKYNIRQMLNYWHHLKFRIRVEIIFLFVVFYTFFTDKFVLYFDEMLSQPDTSQLGLSTIILHLFWMILIFSTPYIYFNLLPKQKGLANLSLYPLKKSDALATLVVYFVKYQLIIVSIATPVLTALTLSTTPLMLIYILIFSCASFFISMIMVLILASKYISRYRILFFYFSYFLIYFVFFVIVYWGTQFYFYYSTLAILCACFVLIKYWSNCWQSWDIVLNKFRPLLLKSTQNKSKLTYSKFPLFIPKIIRPLLFKELLSHIRNKNYIRLKIISFLIYLIILLLIDLYYRDYYTSAISILTILLIWEHYSHQFNDKYVSRESRFFIKVLPIKFYHYGISKFISEFLFIIPILFVVLLMTLLHGLPLLKIFSILGIITLFSIFVLYIITLITVIFYDNPRVAGYAYHFLIIFAVVMNLQFYLVGPIITLFIIIYLHFKSYHQFIR